MALDQRVYLYFKFIKYLGLRCRLIALSKLARLVIKVTSTQMNQRDRNAKDDILSDIKGAAIAR